MTVKIEPPFLVSESPTGISPRYTSKSVFAAISRLALSFKIKKLVIIVRE